MSEHKTLDKGYKPSDKRGYQPSTQTNQPNPGAGYQPTTSEGKPTSPPPKKP